MQSTAVAFHLASWLWHVWLQVYKGGIGSYGLIVMVAAFLLLYPGRAAPEALQQGEACNLGELLLDFFRLYGRTLTTSLDGISCRCLAFLRILSKEIMQ